MFCEKRHVPRCGASSTRQTPDATNWIYNAKPQHATLLLNGCVVCTKMKHVPRLSEPAQVFILYCRQNRKIRFYANSRCWKYQTRMFKIRWRIFCLHFWSNRGVTGIRIDGRCRRVHNFPTEETEFFGRFFKRHADLSKKDGFRARDLCGIFRNQLDDGIKRQKLVGEDSLPGDTIITGRDNCFGWGVIITRPCLR